ncbi:MAG: hypothetical protein ABW141_06065 [Candidatus Thiodiazotropha endolucinida]
MANQYSVKSIIKLGKSVIYPKTVGDKIRFVSVLPEEFDVTIGGNPVQMRQYSGPISFPPNIDPRSLVVYVNAETVIEAAELALDATEWVTDYLAFSFASPIPIQTQQVELIGGSEVNIGEPMDIPKFRSTEVHLQITRQDPFTMIDRPEEFSENMRAALRWYHKGLDTSYDVDRFIFFWISLEILAKADDFELIPTPFRHSCGHEIHKCPACNESLLRPPPGEAARVAQFMRQLGVSDDDTKSIRNFRQVVHGKGKLTLAGTRDVDQYNEILRAALNLALKRALGIPDYEPPIVSTSLRSRNIHLNYQRSNSIAEKES